MQTLLLLQILLESGLPLQKAKDLLKEDLALLEPALLSRLEVLFEVTKKYGGVVGQAIETLRLHHQNAISLRQEITVASRGPKSTAKIIVLMPLIALLMAQLIGVGVLQAATKNIAVPASILVGVVLMFANQRFAAHRITLVEAEVEQILANQSGFSEAMVMVAAGVGLHQIAASPQLQANAPELVAMLNVAADHGLAASALVQNLSTYLHASAAFELRLKIATFQTKLLAPLALLALPVLVFLAIIPTFLAFITN